MAAATLLGDSGDIVDLGRLQPRLRSARHERLHRRVRQQPRARLITRTATPGNGNLTVPLLFRDGNLGPRAHVSAAAGAEADGLPARRARVPVDQSDRDRQREHRSIRTCRCRTRTRWTVGFQRALGTDDRRSRSGTSARAAAQQWETFNYNEPNILENKLPRRVQARAGQPAVAHRAGCGGTRQPRARSRIAVRGPARRRCRSTSRSSAAIPRSGQCRRRRRCTRPRNWTSSNFVNPLASTTEPVHARRHEREYRPGRAIRRVRRTRSRAGLPANFFRVNPDMLGGANATGNRGFSKYNAHAAAVPPPAVGRTAVRRQLRLRPRHAVGALLVPRAARVQLRATGGEGDVTHAFKATGVYELPFGQGQRFATRRRRVDGPPRSAAGRSAARRASRPAGSFDLGNVRVVGMSEDEVQDLFKMRKESDTIIYAWPQDDHRRDDQGLQHERDDRRPATARSVPPSGKYFAPANGPDCIETHQQHYGDCGVQSLVVTGPMVANVDLSVRKRVKIAGRVQYEFSLDIFNVLQPRHVPAGTRRRRAPTSRTGRPVCRARRARCRSARGSRGRAG